jgi:hypothetical protein
MYWASISVRNYISSAQNPVHDLTLMCAANVCSEGALTYHYDSENAAVDYDALMSAISRLEKVSAFDYALQAASVSANMI